MCNRKWFCRLLNFNPVSFSIIPASYDPVHLHVMMGGADLSVLMGNSVYKIWYIIYIIWSAENEEKRNGCMRKINHNILYDDMPN